MTGVIRAIFVGAGLIAILKKDGQGRFPELAAAKSPSILLCQKGDGKSIRARFFEPAMLLLRRISG